jgi:superfamily II DNA/RNA helicase
MPISTANTRPAQDALEALQQGFASGHEHGTTEDVKVYRSFDDMPVDVRLLRGIYSHGFEKPSPIQQRAIVPMLKGGDLIGQAQAGTGKTGAFCVGLLGRIDIRRPETQGLLLSPTRELAEQNYDVLCGLGAYLVPEGSAGLLAQLVVGGTRRSDDLAQLQARPPLVVVGDASCSTRPTRCCRKDSATKSTASSHSFQRMSKSHCSPRRYPVTCCS